MPSNDKCYRGKYSKGRGVPGIEDKADTLDWWVLRRRYLSQELRKVRGQAMETDAGWRGFSRLRQEQAQRPWGGACLVY